MNPAKGLLLIGPIFLGTVELQAADDPEGLTTTVSRWFSQEFRRTEKRLQEISEELTRLPQLRAEPFANRYGFCSQTFLDPDQESWLQIDLERSHLIDRFVIMPALIPKLGRRGEGYGFPRRFRIEVSDNPGMKDAVLVVDQTNEDLPNPGRFPEDFKITPTHGRYVRLTSTRHFPVEDGFLWAFEELLVLSGNQPVSIATPVTGPQSFETYPNWSHLRANNGQSRLGMALTTEVSPTRGFLSLPGRNEFDPKWIQIDFGEDQQIDQIHLLPVEQKGLEIIGPGAFPRAFKVELATDSDCNSVVWRYTFPSTNLVGYPGACAIIIQVPGSWGRYLRMTSQRLWGVAGNFSFGLAEIQAFSGHENIALAKTVTTNGAQDNDGLWEPRFVADGYGSHHALASFPAFLDQIRERRRLSEELAVLTTKRSEQLQTNGLILGYGSGSLGILMALGCGWLAVRQQIVQRRAIHHLRGQIARDLHDDLGSNLGGIALISELGSQQSNDPQAREDFRSIQKVAESSSHSMQDIIWLIGEKSGTLRDLVIRMRETSALLLGNRSVSITLEPPDFSDQKLSLVFRRHFFLAFKEALNNVRQHSGAKTAEIKLKLTRHAFEFEVKDDGQGFDLKKTQPDRHGLLNLYRRAARLEGNCRVTSESGSGTQVSFKAPFQSKRS